MHNIAMQYVPINIQPRRTIGLLVVT